MCFSQTLYVVLQRSHNVFKVKSEHLHTPSLKISISHMLRAAFPHKAINGNIDIQGQNEM